MAKGVAVCHEWDMYGVFRAWALNNGFRKGLTLDRIDSDGGYSPTNCQWITGSENSRKDQMNERNQNCLYSDEQVQWALQAHESGMGHRAIAAEIGCTRRMVNYWVNQKFRPQRVSR